MKQERDVLAELAQTRRRLKELERAAKREAGMRQARRTGEIAERRPGVWRCRVFLGHDPATGKRQYKSEQVRGTKKDAEEKLRSMLGQRDDGTLVAGASARGTVGEWLECW